MANHESANGVETPATIGVSVDNAGNFTYTDAVKKVKRGVVVQWECDYDFAVDFCVAGVRNTPFSQSRFQSASGATGKRTIRARVDPHAKGSYSYFVAVYGVDARNGRVVWTDDPQIVILEDT